LYGVLDKHLANSKSGFLVGDHISTADITNVSWVIYAGWAGVDIEEFPHLKSKWRTSENTHHFQIPCFLFTCRTATAPETCTFG
jgi:glutathione S-transferase